MRFFSKAATVLLLMVLGAAPAFAATPCQEEMRSSMCCKAGCAMMAAMTAKEKSVAHFRMVSADSSRSCCKTVPGTPSLTTAATAPAQQESMEMAPVRVMLASYLPNTTFRVMDDHAPPDRQLRSRSQSILCTYRI